MTLDEAIKIVSIKDDIIKPLDRQIAIDTLVLYAEAYKVAIEQLSKHYEKGFEDNIIGIAKCRNSERNLNERLKQERV